MESDAHAGNGTVTPTIPLEALNVGYNSSNVPQTSSQPAALAAGEENSNDGCCQAPVTPQRAHQINPGTPFTPMANLKMLIAAASSALDREKELECAANREDSNLSAASEVGSVYDGASVMGDGGDDGGGRKMKSLSVLCRRFLEIAEDEVGMGQDFSLENMAQSLGTNRRRIYDIINVLEALEMIVKQSKNWYTWLGRSGLISTLAKLRAMALDDSEFGVLFDKDESNKENQPLSSSSNRAGPLGEKPLQETGGGNGGGRRGREGAEEAVTTEPDGGGRGGRWDKSLGVLCQKFVMLFLIAPNQEVTLDCAGSVLMPEGAEDTANPFAPLQPSNSKTKVRRLYDIANVLSTLGLIKKRTFMAPNHRKMPGYAWCGPSISEIEAIPVYRKSEYSMCALYSKKKGVSLTRKPSFTTRPFLHQYEVKEFHRSAPTTPVKTHSSGFRRSLSFGAPTATKQTTCVVARPLCPKQLDYLNEVQEFEAEMQKHSHRYPHVASVFHEFIQKYQSTLEHAAMGRSILPKPVAITASPTLQATGDLASRVFTLPSNGSSLPPSPEMPMCVAITQSPTMAAMNIVNMASSGSMVGTNGASTVSKPYRKILPAPTRDSTPVLLRRANEIMNRKASTVLSNSPTHLQTSPAAACNPPSSSSASPTKISSAVDILSTQTPPSSVPCEPPESAAITNELSSSAAPVWNRATAQTVSSSSSLKLTSNSESTSVSPLTTPEFSQSSSSCLSESNEGKSKSSPATKQPSGTATLSSVQPQTAIVSPASPPPLLLLMPQSAATNGITALNQLGGANLSYFPTAKPLYTNGSIHVSTSVSPPSVSKTNPSIYVKDGTNRDPHSQSKSVPADKTYTTPAQQVDVNGISHTALSTISMNAAAMSPCVTAVAQLKSSSQQEHTSPPKVTNTTLLATCGTLHSPNKEAHSRSFVNVEEFLIPVGEARKPLTLGQGLSRVQKADIPPPPPLLQLKPKASCGNVPLVSQEQLLGQISQVNPPVGVQPLPTLSWPSSDQQSQTRSSPNTMEFLPEQRPIPETSPATNGNGPGVFSAFQRFDPNTFLAQPSQIFTSPLYSNGSNTGTLYPLVTHLPPFSSFCPLGQHSTQTYQQAVISMHSSKVNYDTLPPKRPRLE